MFTESKITEIYCMADDFCKEFALQQEKYMIENKSRHRSSNNFIANSLSAIAAYCFFEKKPAIDVNFINDGQPIIF